MTTVLMTADTVGGVWTYALELADALAPHDVRVQLATMGPRMSAAQRAAVESSAVAGVHESRFALEWMPDPWDDVDRAGEWLLHLAAEVRPDVVHLNGYAHAVLPWPAPVVVVAHSCVVSWWAAVRGGEAPREWDEYRARVGAGLRAADAIVAPTAAMLAEVRRCHGIGPGVVVPNCRSDAWAHVVDKEPVVLGAGRVWDEAKNLCAVTAVASELPWPVVIAGDPTPPLPAPVRPDPAGGATLLGTLAWDELAAWLRRASVYVAPSSYEPFGLGPLEAAQAGCALVLGDIPSLREVWGDAATFVDPRDDRGLAAAVRYLTEHPTERADLSARARHRAEGYTPQRTAAGYRAVYDGLPVRRPSVAGSTAR
jgi:glycogen(starch) synthase